MQDLKGNQKQSDKSTFQPSWLKEINNHSRTLRCFNSYGLFRVMTITRPEIIIEGSLDGKSWEPYEFKWKPSHANQALRFTGPHMPRLDWQMWFEGLNFENYVKHPFPRFLYGRFLLMKSQGEPNSVFADLPRVLGTKEFQSLRKASPSVQNQALTNYNNLIQAFISRSEWFGNLLQAIAEQKSQSSPCFHQNPKKIKFRISSKYLYATLNSARKIRLFGKSQKFLTQLMY